MFWSKYFRRKQWDAERARELEAYLEIEAEKNISSGMREIDAQFAASRKLGNATQIREVIYHMNSIGFFETLWKDLRFALRMLRKKPTFTIAAVLTLALGIGATTAIFSVVNSILLKPLPFANSSRLIVVTGTSQRIPQFSVSLPDFFDFRKETRSFSQMAAGIKVGFTVTGVPQPEAVGGYYVTQNFLSMMGVHPMLGRDFLPEEEQPGTAPVVLLSYHLWQSQMHSDANVVGRSIQLDGASYTVVGVLPQSFFYLDQTDLLAPLGLFPTKRFLTERANHGDTDVVGRIAPRVKLPQAKAELDGIAGRLAVQFPASNSGDGVSLAPIRDVIVGDASSAILILFGAVMFVLLIACANVANLYLVRGAQRTKEIAIRLAFGAGRAQVVRQLLTESLVLATLGGALGTLLGYWSLSLLKRYVPTGTFMGIEIGMDGTVLAVVALMIIFVSIAFGLIPALHATRPDVQEALKDVSRGSTSSAKQHRLRGMLAIAETALALVLVIGAGLMLKSLYRLFQVDPGFQQDHVLTMTVSLPNTKYNKMPMVTTFWEQVLGRVKNLPGVEDAAVGTIVPFTGDHRRTDITIDGQPLPTNGNYPHPDYHTVSQDYFNALKIPLLKGRTFTDADNETSPLVGIINSKLASLYWSNVDPVGKQFILGHPGPNSRWVTVIGVVSDTKIYGLANPTKIEVYIPYRQRPNSNMTLVVRSAGDPAALTSAVQSAITAIDKDQAVSGIQSMKDLVESSVSTRHVTLVLLELFSGLALVLASIGIYGVMAYTVALRTTEIGVRMALGAQKKDVLRMVMGQGARLALAGVVIGELAAFALSRLLSSLLFSVSASDPIVFASVPLLLIVVTLIACYIPAARAMKVDPMIALRYE